MKKYKNHESLGAVTHTHKHFYRRDIHYLAEYKASIENEFLYNNLHAINSINNNVLLKQKCRGNISSSVSEGILKKQTTSTINNNTKQESKHNKGITLVALVVTIIIIVILATTTIKATIGENGLITKAKEMRNHMANSIISDEEMINELLEEIEEETGGNAVTPPEIVDPPTPPVEEIKPTEEKEETVTYVTENGDIEVIWLKDATNTVSQTPNAPNLYNNSMKLVTWHETEDGQGWEEDSEEQTNAKAKKYEYKAGVRKEENRESMWANAKNTANGEDSYFVWIPRYAYRITYYEDRAKTKVTGYYDGYGMWNAETKKVNYELDEGIETVNYQGKSYIVHPAFMKDIEKTDKDGNALEDYGRGGWNENQTGIWVAKYEMSEYTPSISGSGAVTKKYKSVPGVASKTNVKIGNMYDYSYNYDRAKESHLMKNSEWGAVAYLTHSQYGRNGYEIDINNSSTITGNGGGSTNAGIQSGITNEYNTKIGAKASTTGNIYGVYDMSGGKGEYTAGFCANTISSAGGNMVNSNKTSTRYATAYENAKNSSSDIQTVSKMGDGIKEVYKRTTEKAWYNDYSYVVSSSRSFSERGGNCDMREYAGVFCTSGSDGYSSGSISFRAVLGS